MAHPVKQERFQYLDLLRFTLAVFVMFFHYLFFSNYAYGISNVSPDFLRFVSVFGGLGIQIFFVISGFVILYTAHNKGVFDFFVSRISRLLPGIMIVSVIGYLSFLLLPSPKGLLDINFISFLKNFTGLSVSPFDFSYGEFIDGSMWSLRYELGFYILVFLLIFTKHIKYLSYYVCGWASFGFIKMVLYSHLFNILPEQLIGNRFTPFFSVGILIYILKSKIDEKNKKWNILFLIMTILYSSCYVFTSTELGEPLLAVTFYVIGLIVFLMAIFLRPKHSEIYAVLGGSSYVLYLIHQNFGYRIMMYFGNWYWYKSLVLAVSMILLSIFIHIFIEKKMISLFRNSLKDFLVRMKAVRWVV